MAKVGYTSLKLKTDTSVKTVKFQDREIEVLQYLPIDDKYDIMMITIQNSKEGTTYNPLKLDMYFNLYMVIMYSNLSFTDKNMEDLSKLYDTLKSNGLMDLILEAIPEQDYNELQEMIEEYLELENTVGTTMGAVIKSLIQDLPRNAEAAMNIVENFDPQKYQAVIDFAKAANGGRPIE